LRRWRWGIVNPNFGWRSKRSERLKNDRECRERERERDGCCGNGRRSERRGRGSEQK
jgi:hypothetical protein